MNHPPRFDGPLWPILLRWAAHQLKPHLDAIGEGSDPPPSKPLSTFRLTRFHQRSTPDPHGAPGMATKFAAELTDFSAPAESDVTTRRIVATDDAGNTIHEQDYPVSDATVEFGLFDLGQSGSVAVAHIDAAGNVGEASDPLPFTVTDTEAPAKAGTFTLAFRQREVPDDAPAPDPENPGE